MNDEDIVVTTTIETGVRLSKIEAILNFIFFMFCLFIFGYLLGLMNKSSCSSEKCEIRKTDIRKEINE